MFKRINNMYLWSKSKNIDHSAKNHFAGNVGISENPLPVIHSKAKWQCHVGDMDEVPGIWIQPGHALAAATILGVIQQTEALLLTLAFKQLNS